MPNDFSLSSNSAVREPKEFTGPTAFVLYDDLPAGQHAMRTLTRAFKESGHALRPHLWRFDLLSDSDWFGIALAEAIGAEVIVISTSSATEFKPSVRKRIEKCLAKKCGSTTAIIGLLGPAESLDLPDSSRRQFLQIATQAAGLHFFAPLSRRSQAPADLKSLWPAIRMSAQRGDFDLGRQSAQ